jgi:hypothetical protein
MEIVEALLCCLLPTAFISFATAHGSTEAHKQAPIVDPEADWATKHMAGSYATFVFQNASYLIPRCIIEEHHIGNFDGGAFFKMHDYDGDGDWDEWEIQKTYGLMDQTAKDIPQEKRDHVVKLIMELIDKDGNRRITRDEWMGFLDGGGTLPDLGTGPGHHGDIEYEYEIHHWEK